jgi:GH35 family endo-1,4-beta-xylanase
LANNSTNRGTNNNLALAAADTYIANFRQGPAEVTLVGAEPGTPVEVRMVRNAFNFGTMVQGFNADVFLAPVAPGDTTSVAARYQKFVRDHFNIVVPSNMGKWSENQASQGTVTMGHVDTILNYAHNNNLNVRMHNLIWGNQQPSWVNSLISTATNVNLTQAQRDAAKASLMTAIANRISYYVGDGDDNTNDNDRSQKYVEIDVLNEALRYPSSPPSYWEIFGASGMAEIYDMVRDAVDAAGANTRLYTNEYNIFQFANSPTGGGSDPYANWYRRHVEEINSVGYGQVVTGIGIQSIADPRTALSDNDVHSASRINQVMQNLSITGLPITLTEFSVPSPAGFAMTPERSAQIYGESLRMLFGSPLATSFLIWEAWPSPTATPDGITTIVDQNWNLTQSGQTLVNLLNSWTTPTQNLVVGADGTIDFTGFYGQYEVTVDGQTFDLDLTKGTSLYSIVVAPGDYNADGMVNAADYVIWRKTVGSPSDLRADGNGDLVIDDEDFDVWRSHFGAIYGAGAASLAGVPEPTSIALLMVACAILAARSRH